MDSSYGFWNLSSLTVLQTSFLLVCNIWYNTWETLVLDEAEIFVIYMQVICWTINSKGNKAAYLAIGT